MKKLYLVFYLSLLLFCIAFMVSNSFAQKQDLSEKRIHTVVKGDTLWDICKAYYNNPFLWPKLWAKNPHISNPHLIYPGDKIEIFTLEELLAEVKEEKVAEGEIRREEVPAKEEKFEEEKAEIPRVEIKEEAKHYYYSMIASCGFVMDEKPQYFAKITGDGSPKGIFGEGETLYAEFIENKEFKSGSRFSIIRVEREIVHPINRRFSGYLISILGQAELVDLNGNMGMIKIINSFGSIRRGDVLVKYFELDPKIEIKENKKAVSGYIIDNKNNLIILGEGDVIYLDIGSKDGIERGNILLIVREENVKSDAGLRVINKVIGKAIVLVHAEKTSTALIIKSEEPISTGMRVVTVQ